MNDRQFAVAVPPTWEHGRSTFSESMLSVRYGLWQLGYDCIDSLLIHNPGRTTIVFGTSLIEPTDPPDEGSILYNMEQPSTWAQHRVSLLSPMLPQYAVWELSKSHLSFWKEHGVEATHAPLGHVQALEGIAHAAKTIDVFFYGWISARRQKVIDDLRAAGLVVVDFSNGYGSVRDELIGSSKIVLNVHFHDHLRAFEVVRVSYVLANRVCVVSEDSTDAEGYEDALSFVPYEGLVDECVRLAKDDDERERLATRGQEIMRGMPESEILRKVLG